MRVLVIIQARSGSTRLPGKIYRMMPDGRPMLAWVIERARAIRRADDVVVAVPWADFVAADKATALGCTVTYGLPTKLSDGRNDVLNRYYWSAHEYGLQQSDMVVRLTSDCPLLDPEAADLVIGRTLAGALFCDDTRPGVDGLDVEAFPVSTLDLADKMATDPEDRHHVTPWMRRQHGRVHVSYYEHYEPRIAVSVNTHEDLARVRAIATHLKPQAYSFAETLVAARKAGVLRD